MDIRNEKKVFKILHKIFKENSFEKFDIIIDDGSHYLSDILFSLNFFFRFVNQGGTYVIEDFKHPNYYKYNLDTQDIMVEDLLSKIIKKIIDIALLTMISFLALKKIQNHGFKSKKGPLGVCK